jgi:hypothetical protein
MQQSAGGERRDEAEQPQNQKYDGNCVDHDESPVDRVAGCELRLALPDVQPIVELGESSNPVAVRSISRVAEWM